MFYVFDMGSYIFFIWSVFVLFCWVGVFEVESIFWYVYFLDGNTEVMGDEMIGVRLFREDVGRVFEILGL